MAQRRMFSLSVVDTDRFLDMPSSAQALYFHFGMRADDEGFVSSPRKITGVAGCAADDLKLLIAKGFIIPFESGVCVITDWKQNNYLRSDRYTETIFKAEKALLSSDENSPYVVGIPDVNQMSTSGIPRLDKDRLELGKDRLDKDSLGKDICPAERPTTPDVIQEIVSFFNLTVGANYKASSKKTREHINARLREGYTLDDFKTVILKKHSEWSGDPKMNAYLRPETLFGTKFESYLNQPQRSPPQSAHDILAGLYREAKECE